MSLADPRDAALKRRESSLVLADGVHGRPDANLLIHLAASEALDYFLQDHVYAGGLVRDSAQSGCPCSIASAGFAAATYVSAVSLGLMPREEALRRCLEIVTTFADLPMAGSVAEADNAAGYRGFYYHFLHADGPERGRREWKCEVSSIDTALLLTGLLVAAGYFTHDTDEEICLRRGVATIYERIDWRWMLRKSGRLSHGWRPEATRHKRKGHGRDGFILCEWDGYNEGLLIYLLALGSPTFTIPAESYGAWASTYPRQWLSVFGMEHLHCPPLFAHQFPHAFIDFRGIADAFLAERGIDYFENSRRATLAQIEYARRNPHGFVGYGPDTWGLSASNGPGIEHRSDLTADGRPLHFLAYHERGIPPPAGVPDDGTLAPWAAAASLPFLPEAVVRAIDAHRRLALSRTGSHRFMASYNLTYVDEDCPEGWVDEHDLGIEQGPIAMMAANHLHETIWTITRRCAPIVTGLRRAGMRGGWLD